jgi:hypothetical protein
MGAVRHLVAGHFRRFLTGRPVIFDHGLIRNNANIINNLLFRHPQGNALG